jgi:hypothetical protein
MTPLSYFIYVPTLINFKSFKYITNGTRSEEEVGYMKLALPQTMENNPLNCGVVNQPSTVVTKVL